MFFYEFCVFKFLQDLSFSFLFFNITSTVSEIY